MIASEGQLRYCDDYKLIVEVDEGLTQFYRSLVPKHIELKPQRWRAHITVVRNELVKSPNWRKHDNKLVVFEYDPWIYNDETYYWLNVKCDFLTFVRVELGLPTSSKQSRPPDDSDWFHITLGNTKPMIVR